MLLRRRWTPPSGYRTGRCGYRWAVVAEQVVTLNRTATTGIEQDRPVTVGVAHAFLAAHVLGRSGSDRARWNRPCHESRHRPVRPRSFSTRADERIALPHVAVQDEGTVTVSRGAVEHVDAAGLLRQSPGTPVLPDHPLRSRPGSPGLRWARRWSAGWRTSPARSGCAEAVGRTGVAEGHIRRQFEAEPARLHAVVEAGEAAVLGAFTAQLTLVDVGDRGAVLPADIGDLVTDRRFSRKSPPEPAPPTGAVTVTWARVRRVQPDSACRLH